MSLKMGVKKNVLIYGMGNFFLQNEEDIIERYDVTAFIDSEKSGWHLDKRIINPVNVFQYEYEEIIIMVQSIRACFSIVKLLLDQGVSAEHIVLGHSLYGEYSRQIDKLLVLADGRIQLFFGNISIKVSSEDEFNNVCEVFVKQTYAFFINNQKKNIIFDVGMNVGDTALYFSQLDHVEKVYGFEPFVETFLAAKDNLMDNPEQNKINIFQYGISNENMERMITFNNDMTCGQSTIIDIREKAYEKYLNWGLIEENNEQVEQIEVKRASEIFDPIINQYSMHNIVLKMDCEGEEYNILEELLQSGVLEKIKFIMMEWHYRGNQIILDMLKKAGFSWWCSYKDDDMGLIYAYK